ncbi:MAG: 4-hydroxythreonine-4-phosphate dehydrogenase PdxA [Planktomarina sp.]
MTPIAISCGDPGGIGPEITAHAWKALRDEIPMVYCGSADHMPSDVPVTPWTAGQGIEAGHLAVYDIPFNAPLRKGTAQLENAAGTMAAITAAVELVQSGAASAITTAPINKKTLQDGAGFAFPGHTEFLAHLAGQTDVVMMLASPELRVVPTTIHVALADVTPLLTPQLLRQTIETTAKALVTDFGLTAPRLAIAGLDPHAGEGGNIGTFDRDVLAPLIHDIDIEGVTITGPHSADTLFHARARAGYDAAICMYHDQALIPIKTIDFDRGVNVTLGLPFVRTSPDHGTAYDIAGKGIANPASMIEAVKMAHSMARARGH